MTNLLRRDNFYVALLLAGLALAPSGCAGDSDGEARSGRSLGTGPGASGDPGSGGSCDDILESGCDGATGEKLAACEGEIQAAYEACLVQRECDGRRLSDESACGEKPAEGGAAWDAFIACLDEANAAFAECLGVTESDDPGTK
jgi:hypothetical protein